MRWWHFCVLGTVCGYAPSRDRLTQLVLCLDVCARKCLCGNFNSDFFSFIPLSRSATKPKPKPELQVERLITSRVSFFNLSMFRALLLLRETLFADGHLSLVNAKTQDFAKAFTVCLNQLDASGREQLEPKDRAPSEGHVRFTNMILSQVQLHDSALMWQVAGRSMSASIVGNRPTENNSCACCGNVRRWLLQHVFLPKSGARFLCI
jgi:hypothetical protein